MIVQYKNSGVIWRGDQSETFHATPEYIDIVKPNPLQGDTLPGISAGVRDLVNVLVDGAPIVSPPESAQNVVEVLSGFVVSAHNGNTKVQLPLNRSLTAAQPIQVALAEATARL